MKEMNPLPKKPSEPSSYQSAFKYSGLGAQLLVFILIGFWGGRKIDNWASFSIPYFTILLGITGVFGGLWVLLRGLFRKP